MHFYFAAKSLQMLQLQASDPDVRALTPAVTAAELRLHTATK